MWLGISRSVFKSVSNRDRDLEEVRLVCRHLKIEIIPKIKGKTNRRAVTFVVFFRLKFSYKFFSFGSTEEDCGADFIITGTLSPGKV